MGTAGLRADFGGSSVDAGAALLADFGSADKAVGTGGFLVADGVEVEGVVDFSVGIPLLGLVAVEGLAT